MKLKFLGFSWNTLKAQLFIDLFLGPFLEGLLDAGLLKRNGQQAGSRFGAHLELMPVQLPEGRWEVQDQGPWAAPCGSLQPLPGITLDSRVVAASAARAGVRREGWLKTLPCVKGCR